MAWALQDAKAKFSEVIRRAQTEGPQRVTVRGEPSVVVIAEAEFERLRNAQPTRPKKNFIEHLLEEPPWPDDFVEDILNRPKDFGRDIEL
ncbi:prevent-host-death family protein [Bosea sp. CRIB-10]|uniref:type II toxin-antitoxin system Phd/YefM family antitoxin n=1 Tax=Bosea sp. CRIB-10 TaxID=378404 RepID=UPI0008F20EC4|nr:type II toxin-antitoxin system Phd/YefM family antitoxin [Bosea sp. CRIB-10]SFC01244.1 prevent-host-death family protein [Bosea sp. CRIB-10]